MSAGTFQSLVIRDRLEIRNRQSGIIGILDSGKESFEFRTLEGLFFE